MIPRLVFLLLLASCSRTSQDAQASSRLPPPAASFVRCVESDGPLVFRGLHELERFALDAEEDGAFATMLACAEEALRLDEETAWAAHLRAEALAHTGRLDAAQEAFVLALALAPDDPYLLAGLGDFYANHLPPTRSRALTALGFARRGLGRTRDVELLRRLHLIGAWSEADLGRFGASLEHGRQALRFDEEDSATRLVLGRALFELTRFEEAEVELREVLVGRKEDAEALHLLGLTLERLGGREEEAARALSRASSLAPSRFPPPVFLDDEALGRMIVEEVERLPRKERALLEEAGVPILLEALPGLDDLRAEDPPLSPTALGMFRGQPLGIRGSAPREILLYARNLRRAARDMTELREQVRITLLHELGHLAGEDEATLRARGLE